MKGEKIVRAQERACSREVWMQVLQVRSQKMESLPEEIMNKTDNSEWSYWYLSLFFNGNTKLETGHFFVMRPIKR